MFLPCSWTAEIHLMTFYEIPKTQGNAQSSQAGYHTRHYKFKMK